MRTQMIETTRGKRNGHMADMLHGSEEVARFIGTRREMPPVAVAAALEDGKKANPCMAFFSRPTWITTGGPKQASHLKNTGHTADPALRLGAFFGRSTWITSGMTAHVDNRRYTADSGLKRERDADGYDAYAVFMSRPTWITTGTFKGEVHPDNRAYRADPAVRMGAFLSRPTWIVTGVYEQTKTGKISVPAGEACADRTQGYPGDRSLQFATAVLALKMALAGFTGDQRIYPRI